MRAALVRRGVVADLEPRQDDVRRRSRLDRVLRGVAAVEHRRPDQLIAGLRCERPVVRTRETERRTGRCGVDVGLAVGHRLPDARCGDRHRRDDGRYDRSQRGGRRGSDHGRLRRGHDGRGALSGRCCCRRLLRGGGLLRRETLARPRACARHAAAAFAALAFFALAFFAFNAFALCAAVFATAVFATGLLFAPACNGRITTASNADRQTPMMLIRRRRSDIGGTSCVRARRKRRSELWDLLDIDVRHPNVEKTCSWLGVSRGQKLAARQAGSDAYRFSM